MSFRDIINIPYKGRVKFCLVLGIILGVLLYVSSKETCDVYNTYGYILDNELIINIPTNYPDTINNMEYIKVDNKKYLGKVINISEVKLDAASLINYQEVKFATNIDVVDNQVFKVSVFYNKEKVIKKIKKIIF